MTKKFKMHKYMKEQWAACLISGEYEQGLGSLRSTEGHCCLGVLAEEMGLFDTTETGVRSSDSYLNTDHIPNDTQVELANRNDGYVSYHTGKNTPRHNFAQMAEYIMDNL